MATKAAAAEVPAAQTDVEYRVWYNAPDGVRRSLNAIDQAGVQQIIDDVHADENRRQLLAQSVGLSVPETELGFEIVKVTTTTEQVDFDKLT